MKNRRAETLKKKKKKKKKEESDTHLNSKKRENGIHNTTHDVNICIHIQKVG